MAIGDAAAAAGLAVYPATQDIRLGYQNDNQRGDDIAAVMADVDTTQTNLLSPDTIYSANLAAQTVPDGGILGLGSVNVPAKPYTRLIRIEWRVLIVTAATGTATTVYLRNSAGDQVQGDQIYGRGTVSGVYTLAVPANAASSFQLVASPNGGPTTTTGDSRFSQLRAITKTI